MSSISESFSSISEQVHQFIEQGAVLADARGLTEEHMNAVYALAHNLYQHGEYDRAETLFQFLCYYNHLERKYPMGLAACRHMQRNYSGAVEAYAVAALLDVDDPRPQFHAAECFLARGDAAMAGIALEAAIETCDEQPTWQSLRTRAATLQVQLGEPSIHQDEQAATA